jgi:hypothetical protein
MLDEGLSVRRGRIALSGQQQTGWKAKVMEADSSDA